MADELGLINHLTVTTFRFLFAISLRMSVWARSVFLANLLTLGAFIFIPPINKDCQWSYLSVWKVTGRRKRLGLAGRPVPRLSLEWLHTRSLSEADSWFIECPIDTSVITHLWPAQCAEGISVTGRKVVKRSERTLFHCLYSSRVIGTLYALAWESVFWSNVWYGIVFWRNSLPCARSRTWRREDCEFICFEWFSGCIEFPQSSRTLYSWMWSSIDALAFCLPRFENKRFSLEGIQ